MQADSSLRPRFRAAALLFLFLAAPLEASDRYFMLILSAERPSGRAKYSHTIATFVKDGAENAPLETVTISWLPERGTVKMASLRAEPGRNYGLAESLESAAAKRMCLSLWGPFEIKPELFNRAVDWADRLASGAVRYRALDSTLRRDQVCNCMDAISDLEQDGRRLRICRPIWGDPASYFITLGLLPYVIDSGQTHPWVASCLGLDAYPIVRRDLNRNPSNRPLLRVLQNAAHFQVRKNIPH